MGFPKNRIFNAIKKGLLYLCPFGLWVYSFRAFYSPRKGLAILADANLVFIALNGYLNKLLRGVYPMWNPFNAWGRPDDHVLRAFGEFNPFLYVIPLLSFGGVSFSLAFFLYFIGYFFLGIWGFYLVANKILLDKKLAYLAMLLLLFSSVGTNIFNDILVILILVPGIWFYYFLVSFARQQTVISFLGMTFTAMVLAITYIPFMFLTAFLSFAFFYGLFYPKETLLWWRHLGRFFLKKKALSLFCAFCLCVSLAPGLLYSQAARSGDYITSWRDSGAQKADTINLSLEEVNRGGGIIGSLSLERIFCELGVIPHLGFIYIPVFWTILAALGGMVPLNRRLLLLVSTGLLLLGISLGGVSPVHRFLFQHIFFIRSFRNLHFFVWFSFPFFILFLTEQLKHLIYFKARAKKAQVAYLLYSVAIHFGLFLFLRSLGHVIMTTFVTVFLSLVLFLLIGLRFFDKRENLLCAAFLLIVCLQPIEVYQTIVYNTRKGYSSYSQNPYTQEESLPRFSFKRPRHDVETERKSQGAFGDAFNTTVADTAGFIPEDVYYHGLKSSYVLHNQIPRAILSEYVIHKFIAYDHVHYVAEGQVDLSQLQKIFSNNWNLALVESAPAFAPTSESTPESIPEPLQGLSKLGQAQVIAGEDQGILVLDFDVNHITFETNFPAKKFLVYNDSYHKDWFAFINGKNVPLFKANGAFKGLWVPEGLQVVHLRFRPLIRYFLSWGLIILFLVLGSVLLSFYLVKILRGVKACLGRY